MNKHLFHYRLLSLVLVIHTLTVCQTTDQVSTSQPTQTAVTDMLSRQPELSDANGHVEQATQPIVAGGASIASDIVNTTQAVQPTEPVAVTTGITVQSLQNTSVDHEINKNQTDEMYAQTASVQPQSALQEQLGVSQTIVGSEISAPEQQPVVVAASEVQPAIDTTPTTATTEMSTIQDSDAIAKSMAPEVDQIAQSQTEFDEGIDTLDEEDSGNWYLKRSLWKKAKPKYDEIRKVATRVERSIKGFLDKRKKIEESNDSFFFELGVDQGEITQIVAQIIAAQKKIQPADEKLTEDQKKEAADTQAKRQEELDKLKNYVDVIKKTDDNLMDAIFNSLIEQQQLVQSYEEKALDNYYKISEILDDKKARELLNEMDNFVENVYAIEKWINGPLTQYVDQSGERLTDLMQKTHMLVSSLKQQGIELKKQLTQDELNAEEIRKKAEAEKLAKAQAAARAAMKQKGFFATIWSGIVSFFDSLITLVTTPFTYMYSLVFGSSPAPAKQIAQVNKISNA